MLRSLLPKDADARLVLGIVLLGFLLLALSLRLVAMERELRARPATEVKTETRTVTRVVEGPTKVVERIVYQPGGVRIIEREVNRDSMVTEKGVEKAVERTETPVSGGVPKRYVGVMVAPDTPYKAYGVRGGMTIFGRFDIGVGYRFHGPWVGPQAELSVRF